MLCSQLRSGAKRVGAASPHPPRSRGLRCHAQRKRLQVTVPQLEVPDYYTVYSCWSKELEQELAIALLLSLGTTAAESARVLRTAFEHHTLLQYIFLNPGRLAARLSQLKQLEAAFPGFQARRTFVKSPLLISHPAAVLRAKAEAARQLLDVPPQDPRAGRALTRCPGLLTRSTASSTHMMDTLRRLLGKDAAQKVALLYPELFGCSAATLERNVANLQSALGLGASQVARVLRTNPSLITREHPDEKIQDLAQATQLSAAEVSARARGCLLLLQTFMTCEQQAAAWMSAAADVA